MTDQVHYASNFRSFLTSLVVLHHTAVSYGGEGGHVFKSSQHPPGSSAALVAFNAVNQSFFMGSFFFLAGHYSNVSLQHKSREQFVKGRLYRLGIPSIAYTILAPPICQTIIRISHGETLNWSLVLDHLTSLRGIRGPVWFTSVLLLLDLAFALLDDRGKPDTASRKERTQLKSTESRLLPGLGVESAVALCSVVDFVWRLKFPVNRMFQPLNLNLGYFPQYVAAYWFGSCVASPRDAITGSAVFTRLLTANMACNLTLMRMFQRDGKDAFPQLFGGLTPAAAVYAVWNNTTGYVLGSSLLSMFSTNYNVSWGRFNATAFPAFLVHIPVSVLVEAYAEQWKATAITKTAVVGSINIAASWAVGYCLQALWGRAVAPKNNVRKKVG